MRTVRFPVVAMSVVLVALMWGCATTPGGGSNPVEAIGQTLALMKAGFESQDPDKVLTAYSEDYDGPNGEDKEEAGVGLEDLNDQGYWEGMEVTVEGVDITVEGETATVGPIEFSGSWGTAEYIYEFKKDADGVWRVSRSEQY